MKKKEKENKEMTLQDHAEAWCREQGQEVPERNTIAHQLMYEDWVDFAFQDFKKIG